MSGVSSDACNWGFGGVSETHRWWIRGQWWESELVPDAQINISRKCLGRGPCHGLARARRLHDVTSGLTIQ